MTKWFLGALSYATLDLNSFIYSNLLRTFDMLQWEKGRTQPFSQGHKGKYWGQWTPLVIHPNPTLTFGELTSSYWSCFTSKDREQVPGHLCSHSFAVPPNDWLVPEYENPAPVLTVAPTATCNLRSRAPPRNQTEVLPAWHCISTLTLPLLCLAPLLPYWIFLGPLP